MLVRSLMDKIEAEMLKHCNRDTHFRSFTVDVCMQFIFSFVWNISFSFFSFIADADLFSSFFLLEVKKRRECRRSRYLDRTKPGHLVSIVIFSDCNYQANSPLSDDLVSRWRPSNPTFDLAGRDGCFYFWSFYCYCARERRTVERANRRGRTWIFLAKI